MHEAQEKLQNTETRKNLKGNERILEVIIIIKKITQGLF
jgi:hypothetical protein